MTGQSQKAIDGGRIKGAAVIPDCIEVVLGFAGANSRLNHIFLHGRNGGSFIPSAGSANTLFNALGAHWSSTIGAFVPTALSFLWVTVRDMSLTTNPAFQSTGSARAGTSASLALPANVALVLSGKGNLRGKGMVARAYFGQWATNADAGGGVADPAVVSAMNAFGINMLADFSASGLTSCIAKPARQAYTGLTGTPHDARDAGMVDVMTWTLKDTVFDQQRRRSAP